MTIYNFNLGIGWASSGVEYAQAYRANIFRKNGQKAKFIFMDLFRENLQPMTKNIGFDDEQIIWLYQSFTDTKVSPTTFTLAQLEATFPESANKVEKINSQVTYSFTDNDSFITAFIDQHGAADSVYKTETVVNGKLIQRDYYTYVKIYSEYLKPVNNSANLYQRRFFNENGSVAYDEMINGDKSFYVFKDRTIFSKEDLISYFMETMAFTKEDILIMDRATDIGPRILRGRGAAKIADVIHAEHFNEPMTTENNILWNNFYDYQFTNAKTIDFFIAATEIQKKVLEDQFVKYHKGDINIYAIPVGSIDELKYNDNRKKHALVTASRLASEKNLDWMIRAVAQAHEEVTDLTLDIYGRGSEEIKLRQLVTELGAGDYIKFMGHHDLSEVYKKYEAYVSTSTSEGFGLTLLEAVGSGLPMVGFDVRYGNQTFIDEGKNGYLIDYQKNETAKNVDNIAQAIVKMLASDKQVEQMRQHSYEIAENFLTEKIQKSWKKLEEEQIND